MGASCTKNGDSFRRKNALQINNLQIQVFHWSIHLLKFKKQTVSLPSFFQIKINNKKQY